MKKQLENESRSTVIGTAIIVMVMVIVFGAVFAWMYSVDLLFLPDFIKDIFGLSGDDAETPWDLGALTEIVKSGKNEYGEVVTFDVTYENLLAAFNEEPIPEGLYLSADISHYDNGKPSTRRIRYYRDGDRFRAEAYEKGKFNVLETLKIGDAEQVFIVENLTGVSRKVPRAADITPENEIGIPSVNTLLEAIAEFPKTSFAEPSDEADYIPSEDSSVTDCEIKMVSTEDGNVYYIAYTYSDLGLREEYYVSLNHHIIISASTTLDGAPVYSYETVRIATDPKVWSADVLYVMEVPSESAEE